MKNFVITLVLGTAIGFGCAKAIDQPVIANTAQEMDDLVKPGAVFGVAHYVLPEGTDEEAFEKYMADEVMPAWQAAWEKAGTGIKIYLIKRERGDNENKYGFFIHYPNAETRNRYFPGTGATDEYNELVAGIEIPDLAETYEGLEMVHLGDQIFLPTK